MQTQASISASRSIDDGFDPRKQRILGRSDVFMVLGEAGSNEVMRQGTIVRVERRRSLCRPDERSIFVLGSGRVRMIRRAEGREITLGYRGPGDVLGESGLIDASRLLETVVHEQIEALKIPLGVIQQLMGSEPEFAYEMFRVAGERRLQAEDRVQALLTRSVESRVASFILSAADRHGIPDSRGILVGVKYTHQEMASFVGSTRETVTLILGELKRSGLIETDHRRIVVTDGGGLRDRI